ncbi:MAG: HAMP domain-containing sensor histidine kinase [bacterium]
MEPQGRPRRRALPRERPFRTATVVAAVYLVCCLAYIWFSDSIAARIAQDVQELNRIQSLKGMLFVVVTTSAQFVVVWWLLVRADRREEAFEAQGAALAQAEKRAAAAEVAAVTAHDMNNMLFLAFGKAEQLAERDTLDVDSRRTVQEIASAIRSLSDLADGLVGFARAGVQDTAQEFEISQVAREGIDFARGHRQVHGIRTDLEVADQVSLTVNRTLIVRAVLNLVINAAEAARSTVIVRVRRDGNGAIIEAHDDGPGIPIEMRQKILEPFFTTKETGTGLGMLSVRNCAQAHAGKIEVEDSDLGGACVRLRLRGWIARPSVREVETV